MHRKFLKFDFENVLCLVVLLFNYICSSYGYHVMKYKFKHHVFVYCMSSSNVVESGAFCQYYIWCSNCINWQNKNTLLIQKICKFY